MAAFRTRSLGHVEFPYVFADATYVKGRVRNQVVSRAVVVATGVSMSGEREVLGCAVGDTEDDRAVRSDVYPANVRGAAEALARAETLRYDLSDLQPPSFGSSRGRGMWRIFQEFLQNPRDVAGTAQRLEDERARTPARLSGACSSDAGVRNLCSDEVSGRHRSGWQERAGLIFVASVAGLLSMAVIIVASRLWRRDNTDYEPEQPSERDELVLR